MGETGEYSDRSEWPVKAFTEEEKAKELILLATAEAGRIANTRDPDSVSETESEKNPHDPDMRMDYTGTSYFYYTVLLEEKKR